MFYSFFFKGVAIQTDEWFLDLNDNDTIKSNSPFTNEFLKIQNETKIDSSNLTENSLYNLAFIKFLQNNFMPYIFIWAGYVFRNLDAKNKFGNAITHITQGTIEKHFGTTKIANGHIGLYPAEYATSSASAVITNCKMVKSAVVSTKTSKTNSNFLFKHLISFKLTFKFSLIIFLDEQTDINAKDIFQKKSEIKSVHNKVTIIKQSLKKRAAYSYQQPTSHTLSNLNKKIKIDSVSSQLPTSSQQPSINTNTQPDLIIDESASCEPVRGKHDCVTCNKPFPSSGSLYQHKQTKIHRLNLYVFVLTHY